MTASAAKIPSTSTMDQFLDSDDLISMAVSRKSAARRLFERWVLCPTQGLFGSFKGRIGHKPEEAYLKPTTVYGRDEPVDVLASCAVFVTVLSMLIAPLWILAFVEDVTKKLAVITAFTIVLVGILTAATLAKPFETLAVTAG
jgi:hypothetical protein